MTKTVGRQPWLQDAQISVFGNATALCDPDGRMGAPGTGLLIDDRLVLGGLSLALDDEAITVIAKSSTGAVTSLWGCARNVGDHGPDPTVEVHVRREVVAGGLREGLRIVSRAADTVAATVTLHLVSASAELTDVKHGTLPDRGPQIHGIPAGLAWADERHRTSVTSSPAPEQCTIDDTRGDHASLSWPVELAQGVPVEITIDIAADRTTASLFDADPGGPAVDWSDFVVTAGDQRLSKLVSAALADLRCLLLTDPHAPQDIFAAAGTPWYLTLFGRDSLWAARMMLPVDIELAGGTLRALARRQGREVTPETAEEPGKILHEVRRTTFVDAVHGMQLPPVYYGTVDATALWMILLHDAWRQGLPGEQVRDLLPNLRAALAWNIAAADNETGLLRYLDTTGHGLSNQGWKDSGDSMRHRDGAIAPAPISLLEAQAYAVEAALGAAELFDAFGLEGAPAAREFATTLAERIRERFWVHDEEGPYLAMAIDGDGAPVDGVGSNMGHVLGTGALDDAEAAATIRRLTSPDLLGEFGIGTLGRSNPAYNPIGYHTGSVWTHDCAIALLGMVRHGQAGAGMSIARGLVDCAAALDYRAPELFAGESTGGRPAPYPASCRPQAWSAASAIAIVAAVLGLVVDVPGRRVTLTPMRPASFGPVRVAGLRFGRHRFSVDIDAAGRVGVAGLPDGVEVDIR